MPRKNSSLLAVSVWQILPRFCVAYFTSVKWCSLMTHKCRGSIVAFLINKSVEPSEEQKVLVSSFKQGNDVNNKGQIFMGFWFNEKVDNK